jgi:hypothetical protein
MSWSHRHYGVNIFGDAWRLRGQPGGKDDQKRSFCLEQASSEQFDIASDQSPIVPVIGRAGYCYECRQKALARQGKERVFG